MHHQLLSIYRVKYLYYLNNRTFIDCDLLQFFLGDFKLDADIRKTYRICGYTDGSIPLIIPFVDSLLMFLDLCNKTSADTSIRASSSSTACISELAIFESPIVENWQIFPLRRFAGTLQSYSLILTMTSRLSCVFGVRSCL